LPLEYADMIIRARRPASAVPREHHPGHHGGISTATFVWMKAPTWAGYRERYAAPSVCNALTPAGTLALNPAPAERLAQLW
jgi:hypothetical protein